MNIREQALGSAQTLEAGLAAAIKAAQAAQAALEALMVSLMLAATMLDPPVEEEDDGTCKHLDIIEIATMGGYDCSVCRDCGITLV